MVRDANDKQAMGPFEYYRCALYIHTELVCGIGMTCSIIGYLPVI